MKISKQKIFAAQAQFGLTMKQLAELSGISRQNLSTILHRGSCRPDTAGKIARALGVDVTEIMEVE